MKYIATFVALLIGALMATSPAYAYTTTGQTAFTVDGKMGVYVIDFAFGHEKYDVHIPVAAKNTDTTDAHAISYRLLTRENVPSTEASFGIVLSSAKIVNGEYVIEKGVRMPMRLLIITTGERKNEDLRAQVTHLPFSFDGKKQLSLNPTELQYYTTGYVTFGTKASVVIGK